MSTLSSQKLKFTEHVIIAASLSRCVAQSKLDSVDRQFESRERHAWWRKEILMHRAKQEAILRREEVLRCYRMQLTELPCMKILQ